jgi:hypothetical protein
MAARGGINHARLYIVEFDRWEKMVGNYCVSSGAGRCAAARLLDVPVDKRTRAAGSATLTSIDLGVRMRWRGAMSYIPLKVYQADLRGAAR